MTFKRICAAKAAELGMVHNPAEDLPGEKGPTSWRKLDLNKSVMAALRQFALANGGSQMRFAQHENWIGLPSSFIQLSHKNSYTNFTVIKNC